MSDLSKSRAWKLVVPHCDLEERLHHVTPSAQLRGVWYQSVLGAVKQAGKLEEYEEYFPGDRWKMLTYYPLSDFLLRLAVAGAVIESPANIQQGMFRAFRQNATTFAGSLLGKTLLRILAKDPGRLTEQAMAARRQATNYGEWKIVSIGPRHIETTYRAEPIWIESAVAGAAVGTFDVCDIVPTVQTELEDRFNGSSRITW